LNRLEKIYSFTYREVAFWFIIWSILGVILAQTEIADANRGGFSGFAWEPWSWAFSAVYAYAVLTPIIVYYCKKWPYESTHFLNTSIKLILLYIPITLVFITLMLGLRSLVYSLLLGKGYAVGDVLTRYIYEFPKTIPFYLAVVFVTYTQFYQRKVQQEKLNAAKLEVELLDAKLEVLQHQLQPHFLFNTLNLISSTMYKNVDNADSIITRLADILRYSLASKQHPFVSLQQELEVMESYLEIAQLRFGERLKSELNISAETLPVMIPVMLLQPLLENAVKYGIEPSEQGGVISLTTFIEDDRMVVSIVNSLHLQSHKNESFGIGLDNSRTRLNYIYQDKHSLTLTEISTDKIELRIKLPIEPVKNA
jgi:sensor histidine kinase YesM